MSARDRTKEAAKAVPLAPDSARDRGKDSGGAPAGPVSIRPPSDESGVDIGAILRSKEELRTRMFFRFVAALALLVVAFLPMLPGAFMLRVAAASLCAGTAALCFLGITLVNRGFYNARVATAVGVLSASLGVALMLYIGLFSAGVMVLDVGIFFFGLSTHKVAARTTYIAISVLYLVASVLVAANIINDFSLFSVAIVPPFTRWFQVVMSQAIFATTFYLARNSWQATENAIDEVNRHNVQLQKRDALLSEARRELDRALRPGEGRHSGETVGAYRLGDILGRGGMGEVYRAEHVQTKAGAAVKLLHPNLLENPEHVARFLREAQAASAVKTDAVVQVIETGTTASGAPFLAMELLDGHDLGWHLRRTGKLSMKAVVELVDQTARALSAVRDAGIVHRDLKPANLFLTDSIPPRWKVLDFGLSKILGGQTLTRDQAIGTPSYMAPEQVKAGKVDHLTDLYALASLAYRSLTGSPPFAGDEVAHILYKVLYSQPTSPAALARIPIDVELVLAIGMAKEPGDRFPFVEEFAGALRLASDGELDDETRAKGWALLREFPWGTSRARKKKE